MGAIRGGLWGIAVAGVLLGLLWFTTFAQSSTTEPAVTPDPVVDVAQVPGLILTATIGTTAGTCAITSTVQVRADTLVYPCYTIEYTGTQPVALHRIESARRGVITDTLRRVLQPGERLDTVTLGLVITDITDVDVTDTITWTARSEEGAPSPVFVVAFAETTIDVVAPDLSLFKTVGQSAVECPVTQNFRIPSGQTAYYCITLINRGDITLTRHTVTDGDPSLGVNGTFNNPVPPGERLVITNGTLSSLGLSGTLARPNVTQPSTSTVRVESRTASELSVSAVATAVLEVGITTALFTKTLSTDPNVCGESSNIVAPPGSQLYYCAKILNTGRTTLTSHNLVEEGLSIDVRFEYELPPGALLVITAADLVNVFDQPRVFGPLNFTPQFINVVNRTMTYVGRTADGSSVTLSWATSAQFPPTPTWTPTPGPEPTWTPRPTIPFPPTETFTPLPPTETPTPTDTATPTDTPTPTRDWTAALITTPVPDQGGGFTPSSAFPGPQFPGSGYPAPSEGVSAPQFPGTSLPGDYPAPGAGFPPTLDPVSAQFTAIALAETEIAATATALQEALNTPDFPTPESMPDMLPTPAIGSPPLSPPLAVAPAPPDGDSATAPTETATPTPDALVIIVTATPDPLSIALAAAQRPVLLPTPTPTADYLLVAALSFDTVAATMSWLWFLGGSLIFFATAGIVAALFFFSRDRNPYALYPQPEDEWDEDDDWEGDDTAWESTPGSPGASRRPPTARDPRARRADDWPADLP